MFKRFGEYGNRYSASSILNPYSIYGNHFNPRSPFNDYAQAPPAIMRDGKVLGYLSDNAEIPQSIAPETLQVECGDPM